jgi:hypothetical protein
MSSSKVGFIDLFLKGEDILMKPCQPYINQSTAKKGGGKTRNKMEGSRPSRQMKSPKRVNHKGNMKFPKALHSREAYQIRKGGREDIFFIKQTNHFIYVKKNIYI